AAHLCLIDCAHVEPARRSCFFETESPRFCCFIRESDPVTAVVAREVSHLDLHLAHVRAEIRPSRRHVDLQRVAREDIAGITRQKIAPGFVFPGPSCARGVIKQRQGGVLAIHRRTWRLRLRFQQCPAHPVIESACFGGNACPVFHACYRLPAPPIPRYDLLIRYRYALREELQRGIARYAALCSIRP